MAAIRDEEMGALGSNPNPRFEIEREGERRLGEMELDAARALAEMGKIEGGSGEKGSDGNSTRSGKRIERELNARACGESSQNLKFSRSVPAYPVNVDPQDNKAINAVAEERIKVEQNSELSISNVSCPTSHVSCFGRRMKQDMTEAEREARRICRELANRESARQTIWRRQVLREELVKRVADLSLENKNMQVEKELLTKEYLSLKDRNKELKDQMAKAVKSMAVFGVGITSRQVDTSTSPSTELSLVAPSGSHRTAWDPWPSTSSNAAACFGECRSSGVGASTTLFYLPPCAWFYPLPLQASECYVPCSASSDKAPGFIARQHCLRHYPQEGDNLERPSLHLGSRTYNLSTETAAPAEEKKNVGINLEEMPVGDDGHDEISDHNTHSYEAVNPCPYAKGEAGRMIDQLGNVEADKSQIALLPPVKKLVDPSAAAVARKRRKELTKLKYHHWRHIRLHG